MSHLTIPLGLYPIEIPCTLGNQSYTSFISNYTCTPGCRSPGPWLSPSVAWMKVKAGRETAWPAFSNWVASQSRPWVSGVMSGS